MVGIATIKLKGVTQGQGLHGAYSEKTWNNMIHVFSVVSCYLHVIVQFGYQEL